MWQRASARASGARSDRDVSPGEMHCAERGAAARGKGFRCIVDAAEGSSPASARQRASAHSASKTPVAAVTRSISAGVLPRARTEEKSRCATHLTQHQSTASSTKHRRLNDYVRARARTPAELARAHSPIGSAKHNARKLAAAPKRAKCLPPHRQCNEIKKRPVLSPCLSPPLRALHSASLPAIRHDRSVLPTPARSATPHRT